MKIAKNDQILEIVAEAIQVFNEQLPADRKLNPDLECRLVGSAVLDSLDLVNFFVLMEQRVEEKLGVTISLFSGNAEQEIEKLATVAALVRIIQESISLNGPQP